MLDHTRVQRGSGDLGLLDRKSAISSATLAGLSQFVAVPLCFPQLHPLCLGVLPFKGEHCREWLACPFPNARRGRVGLERA